MNTKRKALVEQYADSLTFGDFLLVDRTDLDLTQSEMEKNWMFPKVSFVTWRRGRQFVSPKMALKIAKKVGLSEKLAVKLCLQDLLNREKIKMKIEIAA